ncbi:uncharacterized protein LOC62_05G007325 [Vanrija pseudolonga]|uniref:Uncharacterized protein n=1 Tax=Vanrija pseudolonga TaxID=143232 RepID=A0AAF1BMV6_9TREE|nr:hypothetical protein LOC62_05G007325 [Vanrija pseudolonga]
MGSATTQTSNDTSHRLQWTRRGTQNVELVSIILDNLPRGRDLATCLRVNSFFFTVASAHVYCHVRLFQHGVWKLDLFSVQPHVCRSGIEHPTAALASRPSLQNSVHLVDVFEHSTDDCAAIRLDPIHVDTLRVNLRQHKSRAVLHTDLWGQEGCRALAPIRAKKIIVRGPLVLRDGVIISHDLAPEALDAAEQVTIVATEAFSAISDRWFEPLGRSELLRRESSAQNVTFVFWTRKPEERWYPNQPFTYDHYLSPHWAGRFLKYVAHALVETWPTGCGVTIVNAGNINGLDLGLENEPGYEAVQAHLGTRLREEIQRATEFGDEEDAGKRLEGRVKWLTMREYLSTPGWAGDFGDDEVEPWLKRFEGNKGGCVVNGDRAE